MTGSATALGSEGFDPYSPGFFDDPYPTYEALRDTSPVHYSESIGMWVLSRYDHVQAALRDWDNYSSAPLNGGAPGFRFLIGSDPPDHTTLRRLVNRPFHPTAIAALEPRIRTIAEGLVNELLHEADDNNGVADLVQRVANPLPVIVIAELLGIPPERRHDFKRWSDAMLGGMSPDFDRGAGGVAVMEMFAYFNDVIAERRATPADDLISILVGGKEALSNQELLMFCMLLLVAGNETTTNLISNFALALFAHPEAEDAIRANRALIPAAIEEALRYDAPVQSLWRLTTADVEIDGTTIPNGSQVVILYGSANRDRRKFADPDGFVLDRFDPSAGPPDHVAFGSGIHLCLGAPLARLEARVVTETLLDRTRSVGAVAEEGGSRLHNLLVRGMERLPIALEAA